MFKFFTQKKWQLWAWLGSLIILTSLWVQVKIDVEINEWFGQFYDMIQKALAKPNAITINVWVVPTGTSNLRYIAKGLSIPPASSVELVQGGAKFVINPGDVLNGNASEGTAADVITSVVDKISTIPS